MTLMEWLIAVRYWRKTDKYWEYIIDDDWITSCGITERWEWSFGIDSKKKKMPIKDWKGLLLLIFYLIIIKQACLKTAKCFLFTLRLVLEER